MAGQLLRSHGKSDHDFLTHWQRSSYSGNFPNLITIEVSCEHEAYFRGIKRNRYCPCGFVLWDAAPSVFMNLYRLIFPPFLLLLVFSSNISRQKIEIFFFFRFYKPEHWLISIFPFEISFNYQMWVNRRDVFDFMPFTQTVWPIQNKRNKSGFSISLNIKSF